MAKKDLTFEEILQFIEKLPYHQFQEVVNHYSDKNKANFETEMDTFVTLNLQERLERLEINDFCPYCNSEKVKKVGIRKNVQRYKCHDCDKTFTRFTNTILEKTKWHWTSWIAVLNMTINQYSFAQMREVLQKDYKCFGINDKTLFLWRHKLIHSLASMPQPILTGIIQVDETFIRESQKGSKQLVSLIGNDIVRKPRYGRQPSKYGVMGSEFATVTTAIDHRGYCVCKVSCMGKLTKEMFVDQFDQNMTTPSFICSDANDCYDGYCKIKDIPHYVKPSNYLTVLKNNGYIQSPTTDDEKVNNQKIFPALYKAHAIDYISNRGILTYEEFSALKNANSLSLARVNELHADIKKFIYGKMTNVSTKYLQDYIGFFTYIRNWRITNGHYPNSKVDTEKIFIDILKHRTNYTITQKNNQVIELPMPTGRYINLLKEKTEKARNATKNRFFKFDEDDNVKTFNKREYLSHQPNYKIYQVCKKHGIRKYKQLAMYSVISMILKFPDIDQIIYDLIVSDRHYTIAEEDMDAIESLSYTHTD